MKDETNEKQGVYGAWTLEIDCAIFIDLWYWVWDENKEIIFNELIKDETFSKWENILESYHLN